MNNSAKGAQEMLFFQSLDSGRDRKDCILLWEGWGRGDSPMGEEGEEKKAVQKSLTEF